jgi:hypothetical protein
LEHTFVVEGKTFNVDIKQQEFGGEKKFVFTVNKVQESKEGNTEASYILKPISLSSVKDLPEYWDRESECLNWIHNWIDLNNKNL